MQYQHLHKIIVINNSNTKLKKTIICMQNQHDILLEFKANKIPQL